ncbi:unnamed protein product [Agarophyton chilense]
MSSYRLLVPLGCWTHALLLIVLWSLLESPVSTSEKIPGHMCILDAKGNYNCNQDSGASLQQLERKSQPCPKGDNKCWCMKAISYTNDVRRRHGKKKMLKSGPMTQLQNAMRYAVTLANIGNLEHQDLAAATNEVGCNRRIRGENIAYNYNKGDAAFSCVQQWEKSPPHLENILRDNFDEVAVGFFNAENGRVYCVQTFSEVDKAILESNENSDPCASIEQGIKEEATNTMTEAQEHAGERDEAIEQPMSMAAETEGHTNAKGNREFEGIPQHSLQPRYDEDEQNLATAGDEIEDRGMSEEQVPETQKLSTKSGVSKNSASEIQNPRPNRKDSRKKGRNVLDGIADFYAKANQTSGNTSITVSVGDGNSFNKVSDDLQNDPQKDNVRSVEKEDSTEDGESTRTEWKEGDEGDKARDVREEGSHQMDNQEPRDHDSEQNMTVEKKELMSQKKANVGNRACRCLELGKECWYSLEQQTHKLCTSLLSSKRQPTGCKMKCCSYCLTKPKSRRCTNKVVKRLCRRMRKVIERGM